MIIDYYQNVDKRGKINQRSPRQFASNNVAKDYSNDSEIRPKLWILWVYNVT
jgi:hypothetical protein